MDETNSQVSAHSEIPLTLDYASLNLRRKSRWRFIFAASSLVVGIVILISILLPSFQRTHDYTNPTRSRMNLEQLFGHLKAYANGHAGKFPDSFAVLVLGSSKSIPSDLFVSPAGEPEESTGTTPSELAKNLSDDPTRFSFYVYAGAGLSVRSTNDCVLAYDPLSEKVGRINVLFLDGRVMLTERAEAEKLLAELQSGHNPPRNE